MYRNLILDGGNGFIILKVGYTPIFYVSRLVDITKGAYIDNQYHGLVLDVATSREYTNRVR